MEIETTNTRAYVFLYMFLERRFQGTQKMGLQIIRPQVWQYRLLANGAVARALREGRVDMLGACLVILGRDKGRGRRYRRGEMGNGKR